MIKGLSRRMRRIVYTLGASGSVALAVAAVVIFKPAPKQYVPGEQMEGLTKTLDRSLPEDHPHVVFADVSADVGIDFRHSGKKIL